uniref:Uncharacterized protein n=1 Tax=Fundulus heteroclitus TaxID=8078 RepID=A0A146TK78_FUNHE
MSRGREFQSLGTEWEKALLPIVLRQGGGTGKGMKEVDLRVQEGVATQRRSERQGKQGCGCVQKNFEFYSQSNWEPVELL